MKITTLLLVSAVAIGSSVFGISEVEQQLFDAVRRKDLPLVMHLIDAKVNVNAADRRGNTPLMIAVKNDAEAIVKALLEAGADPDRENRMGQSAFSLASKKKSLDARRIRMLLINWDYFQYILAQIGSGPMDFRRVLHRGILDANPFVVKYALSRSDQPVLVEDLQLAKRLFNKWDVPYMKELYQEIGRMLTARLRVYGPEGRISQTGLGEDLPLEIRQVIASLQRD